MITETLRYLAIVASNVSEFARAKELLDEAIAMHREDNDDRGRERRCSSSWRRVLYNAGRFAEARQGLEQALPIVARSGFRYREAVVTSNLAAIVIQQGELGHGRQLIDRGLELCLELDDIEGIATPYNDPRRDRAPVGDVTAAEESLRQSLEIARQPGSTS